MFFVSSNAEHSLPRRQTTLSLPLDQAHEQINALVKGNGGAVGLTENSGELWRWMVAGPK